TAWPLRNQQVTAWERLHCPGMLQSGRYDGDLERHVGELLTRPRLSLESGLLRRRIGFAALNRRAVRVTHGSGRCNLRQVLGRATGRSQQRNYCQMANCNPAHECLRVGWSEGKTSFLV